MTDRVAARLVVEILHPDPSTGRISADTTPAVPMWMDADGATLTIATAGGAPVMVATLEVATLRASLAPGSELLRFTFQPTEYPEVGSE